MATLEQPPVAALSSHSESPPITPCSPTRIRYPPQVHQTSPLYKRMTSSIYAQAPPLDSITPTGQDYHFNYTRSRSHEPSSRPSTLSGQACATISRHSEEECADDSDEESDQEIRLMRVTSTANFEIEELDSDPGYDCDIEVIQGLCEDAKSEKSGTKSEVLVKMKGLYIGGDSSDEEERELQERKYQQKKKRWSAGNFKRSHSQSVEGDSSYSDNDPLDDVDPNARRLRRRVRGPIDRRGSLIFEDRGFSNTNNIAEVEEPEEGFIKHSQGPPSIPSDDAFTLDELPFWRVAESMDLEIESE